MNNKLNSSNNTRWQILKEYFKDDIKIAFKTVDKVFIITKEDVFYKIDLYENEFSSFVSTREDSIIKNMIFKQLCNKKIIELTSGFKHFIARNIDSKVYIWGDNHWGQLGNGEKYEDLKVPEVIQFSPDSNIIAVVCGSYHSLALTQNGQIYAWGLNSYGQIGCYNDKLIPTRVEGLDGEKITMISCGFNHSMALTENGKVFGWGDNRCGQAGAVGIDFFGTPKQIKLNISIVKISCGRLHSLILSSDGDIYITVKISCNKSANHLEDNQNSFAKLEHEKKFKDIASHWYEDITMGLSADNFYYFWDRRSENETLIPTKTKFKSFNRLFTQHCEYYFESSKDFIKFHDLIFRDGYYKNHFKEMNELGSGSYGKVFKVEYNMDEYAVKKIEFDKNKRDEVLKEQRSFFVVQRLKRQLVVHHFFAWLENEINDSIVLYIRMELCDRTLEDVMDEIDEDPKMKSNDMLTPIGYFIASRIYIEILEGVKYLHENDIIHRDLNPCNIMLIIDRFNERIVRICDFNLITIHNSARQSHSKDKGHVKYVAPEASNGKKYDTKADIYSLGIILWKLFELDMNGLDKETSLTNQLNEKSSTDSNFKKTPLITEYQNAIKLCDGMIKSNPKERLNWDELQKYKDSWSLDLKELDIENEIKTALDFEPKKKEIFIYSIIVSELMKINEKKLDPSNKIVENSQSIKQLEKLIIEYMSKYLHNRKVIEKYLHHLYKYTRVFPEPSDHLINLITSWMREYSEIIGIQWAGLTCLNNITKDDLAKKLDQENLQKVIDFTLETMKRFPNHQHVHETALLILCNGCILNFYGRKKVIRILTDSLNTFNDTEFFISICTNISSRISLAEYLPSVHSYFEKLLDIVKIRINLFSESDNRLDKTLNSLWSLTDLSLVSCEIFIEKGGLDIYQRALNVFKNKTDVATKLLGALTNLAEVSYLKKHLKKPEIISLLRDLMHSKDINASYMAVGIITKLSCDDMKNFIIDYGELENIISKWEIPQQTITVYKNFSHLPPLLNCFNLPAVQMFAVWDIRHLCYQNPKRYCKMLIEIDGCKELEAIRESSKTNKNYLLMHRCELTLETIKNYYYPNLSSKFQNLYHLNSDRSKYGNYFTQH